MTALSERVATAPRIPMRMAVVLALLLLGLVVSIVLIAGSQRPAVPAPFGVAGNGEIVFADTTARSSRARRRRDDQGDRSWVGSFAAGVLA